MIFNAEYNIHTQGLQRSGEALCIQVELCLFVFSFSSGFRSDLPIRVSGNVAVFGTGFGFEELTESIGGLPFA